MIEVVLNWNLRSNGSRPGWAYLPFGRLLLGIPLIRRDVLSMAVVPYNGPRGSFTSPSEPSFKLTRHLLGCSPLASLPGCAYRAVVGHSSGGLSNGGA
jgi:hypothetical protein